MDSKRKAVGPPGIDGDERTPKRQKMPMDAIDASEETPETTTEAGLRFIESLKKSQDKFGRPIATDFLSLPDPRHAADYYQIIQMPISIDTMEYKLKNREYQNLTALESDLKRMISNAKQVNDRQSETFEDAERVRKSAVNFFTRFNPAYRDPTYQAAPTPLANEPLKISSVPRTRPRASEKVIPPPAMSPSVASSNFDATGDKGDSSDFLGKTFMQAQDKILEELKTYMEDDLVVYTPFINLPPRSLTDYYQLIETPMCIKLAQKRVRGIHGRKDAPKGTSDFKTWADYEETVGLIWRNAQQYNEDGSEIYELAEQFQEQFQQRVLDAKAVVDAPAPPRLSIRVTQPAVPSLKLNFKAGVSKSPAPLSQSTTPAPESSRVKTKSEAELAKCAVSTSTATPGINGTNGLPSKLNGIKPEVNGSQPPIANGIRSASQTAPGASPAPIQRAVNGNSHPMPSSQGFLNALAQHQQAPQGPFENKFRPAGETATTSILPKITLSSHPNLQLQTPWNLTFPASNTMTQQSFTITLPGTHSWLQVKPYIPPEVTTRAYRTFVLVNGQRHSAKILHTTAPDLSHPLFEVRLDRGAVNRIEVEVLAGKEPKGESGVVNGKQVDVQLEKCTVFVHVMPF